MDNLIKPPTGKNLVVIKEVADHHNARSKVDFVVNFMDTRATLAYPRINDPFGEKFLNPSKYLMVANRYLLGSPYGIESLITEIDAIRAANKSSIVHFLSSDLGIYLTPKFIDRTIVTFHQPEAYYEKSWRKKSWLRHLNTVVVVSDTQREFFIRNGLDAKNIITIPLGIDVDYYSALAGSIPVEPQPNVVICGQWLRDFDFIDQVVRKLSHIRFEFVGAITNGLARDRSIVQGLLSDCSNFQTVSGLPETEFVGKIKNAACLFLPFRMSTANTALLESACIGTPVITNDLPAVKEYWGHDGCAFFKTGDVQECCELINSIVFDRNAGQRVADRAKHYVRTRFDWPVICKHYSQLYQRFH